MIEIFVLSFIQGVTEFLPVSSSSHLILISDYLKFENQSLSIDVSLHIGSFLAVVVYFSNDIKKFFKNKIKGCFFIGNFQCISGMHKITLYIWAFFNYR